MERMEENMKRFGKTIALLLALCLMAALSGCAVYAPLGMGSWITGESYADAEAYESGAFNYAADAVTRVEIYWRCGQIEVIESDGDELSVRESSALPEKAALHHLLEDGTLRIRFCASGVNIQVRSADKHLTVEVPRGIDLVIHTTSAPVRADALEQNSLLISAHSGSTTLGTVQADSVDLSASSGAIRADSVTAQTLRCEASSGAVRIDALEAETADLHTSSGAVALNLTAPVQLNVRTSSGGVTLALPEGGAEVDYTASSGRLHTDREYVSRGDLCVFGAGESKITVRCSSGGLRIR